MEDARLRHDAQRREWILGMGIKIQLCAGNGGNSQIDSQKFPNHSNPYISIIPTGNMVGNSLGMGSWLGMVGIPKIPKIPKLIPKAFPKKNIYKTEDYGRQNFLGCRFITK